MKEKIIEHCRQIEEKHQIKILFAVESGSRLWRISSRDSDYDVRFVFVQPVENYISLQNDQTTDKVINLTEGEIDLSGFDIFKYCKLLAKSNPSVIEWLQSDILYYGKQPEGLKEIAFTQFNPLALYYHYQSMCNQNYEKYLRSRQEITYKKYLYAMRGLVNARYLQATGKLPPVNFLECLKKCRRIIPKEIIEELKDTIEKKKSKNEKEMIKNIVKYDLYIEEFLREGKKEIRRELLDQKSIDQELRKIVLGKL